MTGPRRDVTPAQVLAVAVSLSSIGGGIITWVSLNPGLWLR